MEPERYEATEGQPAGEDPAGWRTGRVTNRSGGARWRRPLARRAAVLGAGVALAVSLAACSSSTGAAGSGSTRNGLETSSVVVHRTLVIQTGKMDGRPGWPRYVPDGFTAPAGATVVLTIVNHDDGTAPLPPASPWGQVWGADATFGETTGGTELVDGQPVHAVPNDEVSHTFTIPGLLVNVPVPAASSSAHPVTVTFTFRVTKKGTFHWLCTAPCGSGATGMGGAMNTNAWMEGYVTFT
ncbi:MAG: hypothetical protein M0032_03670 [Actinomycetota bacterium]|nr:hypothetical protein [Actinomycetota bacterium]MDA8293767.1 hypothetical protein [Actinomycetota bacterium]